MVADVLERKYTVTKRHGDLEGLVADVDNRACPWPRLILNGLDSVPARHAVQLLWRDRIVDAGTSGTAVALHDVIAEAGPCLMCFFPLAGQVSAQARLAKSTGLPIELIGQGNEVLREDHIAHLDPEQALD